MTTALEFANVEAGHGWDALRVPEPLGSELYERLAADDVDRLSLGPVILSTRSGCTYWLLPPRSPQDGWPHGCRLLSLHAWIVLPEPGLPLSYARWLHRPDDPAQQTGAAWLAAALDTTRRAA